MLKTYLSGTGNPAAANLYAVFCVAGPCQYGADYDSIKKFNRLFASEYHLWEDTQTAVTFSQIVYPGDHVNPNFIDMVCTWYLQEPIDKPRQLLPDISVAIKVFLCLVNT